MLESETDRMKSTMRMPNKSGNGQGDEGSPRVLVRNAVFGPVSGVCLFVCVKRFLLLPLPLLLLLLPSLSLVACCCCCCYVIVVVAAAVVSPVMRVIVVGIAST